MRWLSERFAVSLAKPELNCSTYFYRHYSPRAVRELGCFFKIPCRKDLHLLKLACLDASSAVAVGL